MSSHGHENAWLMGRFEELEVNYPFIIVLCENEKLWEEKYYRTPLAPREDE